MKSVAQVIENRSEGLMGKLASNIALSNLIMAFIGRVFIEANKQGKPIEGISFGPVNHGLAGQFSFKVFYSALALTGPSITIPTVDLRNFVAARSANLAKVLQRNPKVLAGFTQLVEAVDHYCASKGIPFRKFEVEKAFITPDNTFVLQAKKRMGKWDL